MSQNRRPLSVTRLLHQFKRTGSGGEYCGVYDDLSESRRVSLAALAKPGRREQAVIACFFDEEHWTLLTNERLVWKDGSERYAIPVSELTTVTVSTSHLLTVASMHEIAELSITTADGRAFELRLEPGRPFFGFWNVLKLLAR